MAARRRLFLTYGGWKIRGEIPLGVGPANVFLGCWRSIRNNNRKNLGYAVLPFPEHGKNTSVAEVFCLIFTDLYIIDPIARAWCQWGVDEARSWPPELLCADFGLSRTGVSTYLLYLMQYEMGVIYSWVSDMTMYCLQLRHMALGGGSVQWLEFGWADIFF